MKKTLLLLFISSIFFQANDAFSFFYKKQNSKTTIVGITERIPYKLEETTTIHGEKFTPLYINASIAYRNGVPISCTYALNNETHWIPLLDDSTTQVVDLETDECYVSHTELTDEYYMLMSIHQSDITVKIFDLLTGKIVIEQECKINCNNELLDSYNKNGYPPDYKMSDVIGKPEKIDISRLPRNTAYIACWFNSKGQFFYSDIIRFGYWSYDKASIK